MSLPSHLRYLSPCLALALRCMIQNCGLTIADNQMSDRLVRNLVLLGVDLGYDLVITVCAQLLTRDFQLHGDRRGTGGITNGTSLEQVIMYLLRKHEARHLRKVRSHPRHS